MLELRRATKFRDDAGRHWHFRFDTAAIVRAVAAGVDVEQLRSVADWERLRMTDEGRQQATMLMYCLVEPLAERRRVTPEDFVGGLRESWQQAYVAMYAAWGVYELAAKKRKRKAGRWSVRK